MRHTSFIRPLGLLLGSCLTTLAWSAADCLAAEKKSFAQVIVNIDLTTEGKKVPRPTADQPAYYVPVILGWQESGKTVVGEKPPSRADMIRQLGHALAKEGYVLQALRPNANETLPSLILAIEWGYLNSMITDYGDDLRVMITSSRQETPRVIEDINQRQMLTLVAGSAIKGGVLFTQADWEKLRDAVGEDRYFIVVSAFDFAASLKGEEKLLWRARMSTERQGVSMDDVIPALVAAGAPIFGREMDKPEFLIRPVREGKVEVGTPTVVESEEISGGRQPARGK